MYNTISNLLTQDEQLACFRNAARHLRPGGRFVIELWVPDLMGRFVGFRIESRHADWAGSPFTAESPSYVSVYRP